jgi:tmRNA-binding protein
VPGKSFDPVLAENRKARHDYSILETVECGIVLSGTETKSARNSSVSLSGAYVAVLKGELESKLEGWNIVVAPNEAVQLVKFLRDFTNK